MARPVVVRSMTLRIAAPLAANDELDALRHENETLRRALQTRTLVERAKGLLMAQEGLSEPDAHRYIQKSSMDAGTPMTEIARALIGAQQARRGPVTSAQVRKPRWPAPAPRPDSLLDAAATSRVGRQAAPTRTDRLRSGGAWSPAAGRL